MIEPTDEMRECFQRAYDEAAATDGFNFREGAEIQLDAGLAAVLAIVDRDYDVYPRRPRVRIAPPDPCPFCTTGLAHQCPWHGDGSDIP